MEWTATIQEFLQYLRADRNASDNTVMAYRNDLSQFVDYLNRSFPADAKWESLTVSGLSEYVSSIAARYTASTTARKIAAIKTLFHWLTQKGILTEDASMHLKSPKVEKKAPHILTEEEIAKLFSTATNRSLKDRALRELIYATGLRVSEAIGLRIGDVDFETGQARCAGKGSRQRNVPLTNASLTALREYIEQARGDIANGAPTDFIFLNPQGNRLTRQAVWLTTRQLAKQSGIEGEVTPHTLRHSRAAHMIRNGEDVRRVQEMFGHANLATTQMYQHKEKETKLITLPSSSLPL
jgi:integrase/recombinase XerD